MVLKTSEKSSQKKNKRGLWSPEEDQRLKDYVLHHGIGCWSSVPINAGLQRNGKSCRLRWINYLRPGLKRGMFSPQEEELILTLHHTLGNKWSQIAKQLPGRTDNEVKNYWHSYLKKKTVKPGEIIKTDEHESKFGNILNKDENNSSSLVVMSPSIKASRVENNESVLPRLIFAEWLPDDDNNPEIHQIIGQNSSYYSNNNMPKQEEDYYFMHGFGYDKLCQEEGGDVVMQQQEMMMLKFHQDHHHQQSGFVSDFMDFSGGNNNDMVNNNNNNGFLSLPFSLYKEALLF